MCGRYARAKDRAALVEEFLVEQASDEELGPDYNVAPSKRVYVVAQRPSDAEGAAPRRALAVAKWGLVPSWAKDPAIGNRLINARVETADAKPSFRKAFAARRCLVPATGFYEWYSPVEGGGRKQPFFIHHPQGSTLALAGIFEFWRDPGADAAEPWLMTMAVLTTTATDALGRIHERSPLPLPRDAWAAWLDPGTGRAELQDVLAANESRLLVAYPVRTLVNNVRNNGPELLEPLPESE